MLQTQDISNITYNALPGVEAADAALSAIQRSFVLNRLGEVILRHGLEDVVGIRLLHIHNVIAENEFMLEFEETDAGGHECMSTVATDKAAISEPFYPNSWKLENERFVPLEYSLDPTVKLDESRVASLQAFVRDFAAELRLTNAQDILGPWIAPRKFYSRCMPKRGLLLETCDPQRRANIVRFAESLECDSLRLVETTWVARRADAAAEGSQNCSTLCVGNCTPVSACVIDNKGTHSSQSGHVSSHNALHGDSAGSSLENPRRIQPIRQQ
jgi:hypothetical protein